MKEKFIDGIYNYCDRWCERCTFTSRCRNYESTSKLSSEQLDITNKAFWDNITSNMNEALKLLYIAAMKQGFDLNKPLSEEEEANYIKRETFLDAASKNHALSKLCKQYQKLSLPFCESSGGFTDETRELAEHIKLGIKSEDDVVHTIAGIRDCFEIIQWYLFFIDAKLQRALRGKSEGEGENGFQKDSNGSAKIALIAIERSKTAWIKLYELMPSSEDTALKALALLNQLKNKAAEEFPKAPEFKRPGFDK
jgi:hypothetical protein